jgi:glucosamine-6-phosphate deaminase
MESPLNSFNIDNAQIRVFSTKSAMGRAAATHAGAIMRDAIANQGCARIIVATGPSQDDFIQALVQIPHIEWKKVEVFHMDEYVGMPREHPASFRKWLLEHLVNQVHPGKVNYLDADAPDLVRESRRYERLLQSALIHACFLGFGENGHIAFNEPHIADFCDRFTIKRVTMDEKTRMQQVGEGHFATFEAVPKEALTITVPTLLAPKYLVCCVPELRKADATRKALEGPISTACPASIVRTHLGASIFLDTESASLLSSSVFYPRGKAEEQECH